MTDLVTIGLCGGAAFLFGRGIYHSGLLTGWIAQGLRQKAPAVAPEPVAAPDMTAPLDGG